jgi:hypothetical protein
MILGWPPFKIVSVDPDFQPRWPPSGREPSNDYFIKILFLLSKCFQTRRFLWEFPIGSYVKLSSAVGAILIEGPNSRTHFSRLPTKMATKLKIEKRGDEIKKKSSPETTEPISTKLC